MTEDHSLGHDGLTLAWSEQGQGAPVVLLHPGLASRKSWLAVVQDLSSDFRCITPDLPGHGRSAYDPARDAQWQTMNGVEALIRQIGPPVHLVGHSFGGTAALHLAARQPQLVTSLVLIEPVYFNLLHDAHDPAYQAHLNRMAEAGLAMGQGRWEDALDAFLAVWGTEGEAEGLPDKLRHKLVREMRLIQASEPAILHYDTPDRLHLGDLDGLSIPTLLIEGDASPPVIPAIQSLLERTLTNAERHIIAGAGHMAPVTHADKVAPLIRAFYGRLPGPQPP